MILQRLRHGDVCWCSGNGDPRTCLPAARGVAPPVAPYLHQPTLKTLMRGQASRGGRHKASSGAASPGLAREAERSRQGGTSRSSCDVTHEDQGQAGASARSVLVSSLVLKGQAQARSPEASGKGFHIGATRPRPAGQRDGGHHGAQDSVTTRAFGRRRPLLPG